MHSVDEVLNILDAEEKEFTNWKVDQKKNPEGSIELQKDETCRKQIKKHRGQILYIFNQSLKGKEIANWQNHI